MKVPLEITFQRVEKDEAVEELIRQKAEKLERYCDHMNSCRVVVGLAGKSSGHTRAYRVSIDVTIAPSHELAVNRTGDGKSDTHAEMSTTVRAAFEAMEQQVKKLSEQQKTHLAAMKAPQQNPFESMGFVNTIFPEKGYGFVRDLQGNEYYFHRNAAGEGEFSLMQPGTGVRFVFEEGEKGMQCSTVKVINKAASANGNGRSE